MLRSVVLAIMKYSAAIISDMYEGLFSALSTASGMIGDDRLGGRVWLHPEWIVRAHIHQEPRREDFAHLAAALRKPRMYRAAVAFGPIEESSGVTWKVGKGLVGRSALDTADFESVNHSTHWPEDLRTMSRREWRRKHSERADGRRLKDARRLKALYGTAVGSPIRTEPWRTSALSAFGCITLHTAAGDELSDDEIRTCGARLAMDGELMATTLLERLQ